MSHIRKYIILLLMLFACTCNAQTAQQRERIRQQYISAIRDINSQTPIEIDEITDLVHAVFVNWTVIFTYKTYIDASVLTKEDRDALAEELRTSAIADARRMFASGTYQSRNSFKAELKAFGLKMRLTYIDINDKFLFSFLLDHNDF